MSGYESLKARLDFYGGKRQYDRMVADKLRSLRKALLYSYQSNICELLDGRQFLGLINPNQLQPDFDRKVLSIPFEDIQLNEEFDGKKTIPGRTTIGLKSGDVFKWTENNTYWIIYMPHLEEKAYFRAEIRYCEQVVEVNGKSYHVYWKGPGQEVISWQTEQREVYNDMNYLAEMYITKDENTLAYFERFAKIKVAGEMWEVQVVNPDYGEGIIRLRLKEDFNTPISDARQEEKEKEPVITTLINPTTAKPFETVTFEISGYSGGSWSRTHSEYTNIAAITDTSITLNILRTKSGEFTLRYTLPSGENIDQVIKIESL